MRKYVHIGYPQHSHGLQNFMQSFKVVLMNFEITPFDAFSYF